MYLRENSDVRIPGSLTKREPYISNTLLFWITRTWLVKYASSIQSRESSIVVDKLCSVPDILPFAFCQQLPLKAACFPTYLILSSMLLWTFHLWFISHEWKFSPKILSLSKEGHLCHRKIRVSLIVKTWHKWCLLSQNNH